MWKYILKLIVLRNLSQHEVVSQISKIHGQSIKGRSFFVLLKFAPWYKECILPWYKLHLNKYLNFEILWWLFPNGNGDAFITLAMDWSTDLNIGSIKVDLWFNRECVSVECKKEFWVAVKKLDTRIIRLPSNKTFNTTKSTSLRKSMYQCLLPLPKGNRRKILAHSRVWDNFWPWKPL